MKCSVRTFIALALFTVPALLQASDSGGGASDPKPPRWEAGPLISVITVGTAVSSRNVQAGYGGRVTFNAGRIMGFEYQMSYILAHYYEAMVQGSGHLKLTYRMETNWKINLFGIVGPGFLREQQSYTGSIGHVVYNYQSAAIDFGAGMEIVPHRRFLIRLDLTDFHGGTLSAGDHIDFKIGAMFRF
jgi:hypothetical protein